MDPVTALGLTSTVVGITAHCLKAAKSLNELRGKYENAARTIAAICSESTVISASLSQVQSLLLQDPDDVGHHLHSRPEIFTTFDTALTGCMVVYSCLDEEIQRLAVSAVNADNVTWRVKARFIWREDTMKELLYQLRGQQTALNLLIQALQMQSLSDLETLMENNNDMITRVANRSRSLRATHPSIKIPASVFSREKDTDILIEAASTLDQAAEFDFDDSVVNSRAYRRVLAAAKARIMSTNSSTAADTDPEQLRAFEQMRVEEQPETIRAEGSSMPPEQSPEDQKDSIQAGPDFEDVDQSEASSANDEEKPPPLPPRRTVSDTVSHTPSASVYSVPRASSVTPKDLPSSDRSPEATPTGTMSPVQAYTQPSADAESCVSGEAVPSLFSGTTDPTHSILSSSLIRESTDQEALPDVSNPTMTTPPGSEIGVNIQSIQGSLVIEGDQDAEGALDFIRFTEPIEGSPKLLSAQDLELSNIWPVVIQSEVQYIERLQALHSAFREPVSRKWPVLDKHLEALDYTKEIIELSTKEMLLPLRTNLVDGSVACADPRIFQKWCRKLGPTYRAFYQRYPHASAAIRMTYDVDEKFRKFMKGLVFSPNKELGLKDLLTEPMRRVEYYCEIAAKASSLCRGSSPEASGRLSEYEKSHNMLSRVKQSCERILADSANREDMQTLYRSIQTLNAAFAEPLYLLEAGRRILRRGPLTIKPKGKGSWSQVHCILLDNYLFWGRVERAKEKWRGKYKNGEKLWVLEAPLPTRHLQSTVSSEQEKFVKASITDSVPRGSEIYPFTVETSSHRHIFGAASSLERQEWLDALNSFHFDNR